MWGSFVSDGLWCRHSVARACWTLDYTSPGSGTSIFAESASMRSPSKTRSEGGVGGRTTKDALAWLSSDMGESVEEGKTVAPSNIRGIHTRFKHVLLEVLRVIANDAFYKHNEHTNKHTNTMQCPMSLHNLEYFMLHFYFPRRAVCMQNGHQNCRQHCYTLCFQDCVHIFLRAFPKVSARKATEHCYRYWLRFWSHVPDQNFGAFLQASNGTHFKDPRPTPLDHITCPSLGISKKRPWWREDIALSFAPCAPSVAPGE